jgi:hypothetical protein
MSSINDKLWQGTCPPTTLKKSFKKTQMTSHYLYGLKEWGRCSFNPKDPSNQI